MSDPRLSLGIVVPTCGRDEVLTETLERLLGLQPAAAEIIVVDQSRGHAAATERRLRDWAGGGRMRLVTLSAPSVTAAMNAGLRASGSDLVLFVDDDIVPDAKLAAAHTEAHGGHDEWWAVAGQVLQPGQVAEPAAGHPATAGLGADLDFPFHSTLSCEVTNVMAGNLSVKRARAVAVGGFDENFLPPVAYRFETEFARRLRARGGRIGFEPRASVRHLRAAAGGTRALGSHLTSASPLHGAGDYYYALRCGHGLDRLRYMARRPFREVRTRFHLCHPWWIPVKAAGEVRAMALAVRLNRAGPRYGFPPTLS